jgi:flagellar biosynthesis chaperone FliJ
MSPRRARVRRVIEVREKQLDERVKTLRVSEQAEAEAGRQAEEAQARLQEAAEERHRLTERAADVQSWIDANEWLAARSALVDLARKQAAKATAAVTDARSHVTAAHADVRRIELLSDRIENQEKIATDRAERRLDDEIAALRFERAIERWKTSDR